MKKLITTFLIYLIVLTPGVPVSAGSLLTQSSEFSKVATYGMNFATYTAEKKNGKDAVDKLLLFDVVWDVMGKGEEVLLNGDPAAFSNFKDDVLKVQLVLQKVGEVATKLGEGSYDEALVSSVDGMVGIVNHPVVNALWEAVKLTIESHKLVKNTKAELEIETLYGVVNQDRRVMGTPSKNGPPLIAVNSETVTYFFNKYLITNATTRAMVKAYVKTKLGEEFPEISTSASVIAYLTGTSQAVQDEYELQQLQEFENKARGWIKILIEDLNKQVTVQWATTRLRQQRTKFKAFSDQFGDAFKNMDEVFAYYVKVKRLEKEKELYPKRLAELQKEREAAEAQYAKLKPENYDEKLTIRKNLYNIAQAANIYAVNSMIVNADGLQGNFEDLQRNCLKRIISIDKEILVEEDEVVEKIGSASGSGANIFTQYEQSMLTILKPALDVLKVEFPSLTDEAPFDEVKGLLESNKSGDAYAVFLKWAQQQETQYNEALQLSNEKLKELLGQKPDHNSSPTLQRLRARNEKIKEGDIEAAKAERDQYWEQAIKKTMKAQSARYAIHRQPFLNDKGLFAAIFEYSNNEVSRLGALVNENISVLTKFYRDVFYPGQYGQYIQLGRQFTGSNIEWRPSLAYTADRANTFLSENIYTGIGSIDMGDISSIGQIGAYIAGRKNEIMAPLRWHKEYIQGLINIDAEIYRLDSLKNKWKTFVRLDSETIAQYNDLALYDSAEQQSTDSMKIFLGEKELDSSATTQWAKIGFYNNAVNNMDRFISAIQTGVIQAQASTYLAAVDTDLKNRDRDYDYLGQIQKEWDTYYQKILDSKIVTLDPESGRYAIGYGSGFRRAEGVKYARVLEPFNHYATKEELQTNKKLVAAQKELSQLRVYTFIQSSMPGAKKLLDELFTAQFFEPALEENFLVGKAPVWESKLLEAEELVGKIDIEGDSYRERMLQLAELIPFKIEFPEITSKNKDDYSAQYLHERGELKDKIFAYDYETFELGKRYLQVRKKAEELLYAKGRLIAKKRSDAQNAGYILERFAAFKKEFEEIKSKFDILASKTDLKKEEIESLYQGGYWGLRTRYSSDTEVQQSSFTKSLIAYDNNFMQLMDSLAEKEERYVQEIEELYRNFKSAYENKSEYELVDFLSADWDSGDGTTLTDLEDNFRNMFSVYDAIEYALSNIQVIKQTNNKYSVNYDLTIIGEMFDMGIRREEKSSVSEEIIQENGQFKINRTINGRFWYRE